MVLDKTCSKTTVFIVSYIIIFRHNISWTTIIDSNYQIIILDKAEDCLQYEALGAWSDFVVNADGVNQYRTWNFFDPTVGSECYQQYPIKWETYFLPPELYPRTPLG